MSQAADRRQFGASSTPPSHPASGWRRDLQAGSPGWGDTPAPRGAVFVSRAAIRADTYADRPKPPGAAMLAAPILGVALWATALLLLI